MHHLKRIISQDYKIVPLQLIPSNSAPSSTFDLDLQDSKIPFENEAVQYIHTFFSFGYSLLLIPFRFSWSNSNYLLYTNQVQKILCLISSMVGGLYYILKIRDKYSSASKSKRNPAMYFELAYYFCDTLYLLIMFAIFGQKGQEILALFSRLQESNVKFYTNPLAHYKTKFYAKCICVLCLCTLILYYLEVSQDSNNFLQHFEQDATNVFGIFFDKNLQKNFTNSLEKEEQIHFLPLLTLVSIFANSLERILNAFSDILFVMVVLLFNDLVNNFLTSLENEEISSKEVLEHFRWLRETTGQINKAMSLIIGSFVVGNLPFYATNVLDTFRDSCNVFMRLRYLFYCTYFFPSLFLAAKASKDVDEIKLWIYKKEHSDQVNPVSLGVVLHEVNGHPVGLSSFGCLTVNYGLFGSIVSIIVTYALLKTQFQAPAHRELMPMQSNLFLTN